MQRLIEEGGEANQTTDSANSNTTASGEETATNTTTKNETEVIPPVDNSTLDNKTVENPPVVNPPVVNPPVVNPPVVNPPVVNPPTPTRPVVVTPTFYEPSINWFWILLITFLCVILVVGGSMFGLREYILRKPISNDNDDDY